MTLTFLTLFFKNPLARKVALIGLALAGLWYAHRLVTNHAFEAGKREGAVAAWVQAEEKQRIVWDQAQKEIETAYKAAAAAITEIDAERKEFEKKLAVSQAKRQETLAAVQANVAVAEQALAAAPVEVADGLPPKQAIIDLLYQTKTAYDSTKWELGQVEKEFIQSTTLQNKEIAARGAQITAMEKDLDVVKQERDFYKTAFEEVTKPQKKGFKRFLKKVFTLGIAR